MRYSARLLLVLMMLLSPLAVMAEPNGYTSAFGKLYRVDLATGATTEIGRIGHLDVEGLAFGTDGKLYGVSDATETLLRIDTATGIGTAIGGLGLSGQGTGQFNDLDFGLAVTCDGKFWLTADQSDKLWTINPSTGATTFVGGTGKHISGLAARGLQLFGIGVSGDEGLYSLDSSTGLATKIGDVTGAQFPDAGLDFDANGQLWAVIDFSPTNPNRVSELAHLDPNSNVNLTRTTMASFENEGLAIAPSICPTAPNGPGFATPTPFLNGTGILSLILVFALLGTLALARRPTA